MAKALMVRTFCCSSTSPTQSNTGVSRHGTYHPFHSAIQTSATHLTMDPNCKTFCSRWNSGKSSVLTENIANPFSKYDTFIWGSPSVIPQPPSVTKHSAQLIFHHSPCSMISTKLLRCGKIAQPIRIAICCTILMPVCLACQDFLLLHTAFKKGNREGMPRAEATTAKALAVVFRTYSSMLSMSGLMVEIIVARPAAYRGKTQEQL